MELSKACGDCKYWIENETCPHAEIAVRYHYKVVHPFPNGKADFFTERTGLSSKEGGTAGLVLVDLKEKVRFMFMADSDLNVFFD